MKKTLSLVTALVVSFAFVATGMADLKGFRE
jgi:hypothetical protein